MNTDQISHLLPHLTEKERQELDELIAADMAERPWAPLVGPQTMAYYSLADITGYGGAAGGGKTDLAAGLTINEHARVLVTRREKAQTEGFVQRVTEILGTTDGYNSQKGAWKLPGNRLLELAGLDNPGDERRWQGRPHDLKVFDEVTEMREQQVRFVMGWNRTDRAGQRTRVLMTFNPPTTSDGRWVIDFFGPWLDKKHILYPTAPGALRCAAMLPDGNGKSRDVWVDSDGQPLTGAPFVLIDGRVVYDFDPKDHRPEAIIQPRSRTFIPARVTDNPYYMSSGYMATLQSLPEPLRSQMLFGDFNAGIEDDPWQVIPTAWVEAAQARWKKRSPKGEQMALGVDVARGGKDNTVLAPRYKHPECPLWFDELELHPGSSTPNGGRVAGLVMAVHRHKAPINLDVIGVGASPYDKLKEAEQPVYGINVSEKSGKTDRSGRLRFFNLRSQIWWDMREVLDPENDTGVEIPPDPELLKELCAPKWSLSGVTIKVESREEIVERIGRSPDRATALVLANMEMPKLSSLQSASAEREALMNYSPYDRM